MAAPKKKPNTKTKKVAKPAVKKKPKAKPKVDSEPEDASREVKVGMKPVMNYVTSALMIFNDKTNKAATRTVTFLGRGRAISKVVDVVQILRDRILSGETSYDIIITTEQVTDRRTQKAYAVSAIKIDLTEETL